MNANVIRVTTMLRLVIVSFLFASIGLQAFQHGSHGGGRQIVDSNWSELRLGMETMHAAMASVEPSGDSDLDFVMLMLPHHQAAIDMARAQLKYGKNPQMRRLAQEIITDQQSEIELMQLWMKQRKPPE